MLFKYKWVNTQILVENWIQEWLKDNCTKGLKAWVTWMLDGIFVVALAICVSFERMKIWIFRALFLTSIGVGEPLFMLGTSLESLGKVWSQN